MSDIRAKSKYADQTFLFVLKIQESNQVKEFYEAKVSILSIGRVSPFADGLSPIVWKRRIRKSAAALLFYPFPSGLFMQIQDEESINFLVWSSTHTYTKKANSFSLLMGSGGGERMVMASLLLVVA